MHKIFRVLKEQYIKILTEDNECIALWKMSPKKDMDKHIFLTHGAFSNRKTFSGITSTLCDEGFTCWIMEWRNHGGSSMSLQKFNLETVANYDLVSTLNYLFDDVGVKSIDCVTHSGGGLALTMCLIKHPKYKIKISSITLFAVQAFGAGLTLRKRLKLLSGKLLAAFLGKVPAKSAGSIEGSEQYYTLKEWFNWNLNKNFVGSEGFDYRDKMHTIKIPILSICAKGDAFIAPKIGCEQFLKAFDNDNNQLYYCAVENGNLEDYNHSRIILSKNSQKELYPLVLDWIDKNETVSY